MEYVHHGKTECSNEDKFSSVCTNECDSGFQLVGSRVRYIFDHFFSQSGQVYVLGHKS